MIHVVCRAVAAVALAFALLIPATAEAAQVKVKAGQEAAILNVALWRGPFCTPLKVVMKVVQAPRHGTLREVRATLDPAKGKGGHDHFAKCHGRAMPSLAYVYRPNSGFRGKDKVVLRVLAAEDGSGTYYFDIAVE